MKDNIYVQLIHKIQSPSYCDSQLPDPLTSVFYMIKKITFSHSEEKKDDGFL